MKIRYEVHGGGELLGVRDPAFPKPVQFGDVWVPESFTAALTSADLPGLVTVSLRVDAKRGPQIEEITLTMPEGRSVRQEDWDRISVTKVRDTVMTRVPTYRLLTNDQGEVSGVAGKPPGSASAAIRAELRHHSYQRIDDALLQEVSDVYRTADRHPTKAVAERFGVPRPTAARWVMTARRRGFLEPAERPPRRGREE
jgi:hypothetical protein